MNETALGAACLPKGPPHRGGVGHTGVDGSYRGGVGHTGVGGSCRGGVGVGHTGVGGCVMEG